MVNYFSNIKISEIITINLYIYMYSTYVVYALTKCRVIEYIKPNLIVKRINLHEKA